MEDMCYVAMKAMQRDTQLLHVLYSEGVYYVGANTEVKDNYYENAVWRIVKDKPVKERYSEGLEGV